MPWAGSGYRMEIYGREGTLIASSGESPQLGPVRVQGAKGTGERLQDLEIPARHTYVLEGMPPGAPYNVGQMYYLFGQAIRTGEVNHLNFDTAVELHRFLDAIRESSVWGRQAAVTTG